MARKGTRYARMTFNLREDQREWLTSMEGLNASGFVRELLDYYRSNLEKTTTGFQIIGGSKVEVQHG